MWGGDNPSTVETKELRQETRREVGGGRRDKRYGGRWEQGQEIRREEGGMVRQRSRGGVEREKPRSVANMRERDRTLR